VNENAVDGTAEKLGYADDWIGQAESPARRSNGDRIAAQRLDCDDVRHCKMPSGVFRMELKLCLVTDLEPATEIELQIAAEFEAPARCSDLLNWRGGEESYVCLG